MLHNSVPLLLSLFLPDTQLLLFIWITFLCYGISVVFPLLPPIPLPFPHGRIPEKTSFWKALQAHLLSGYSMPGGPGQGLGSWGARTRWAAEAGGQGSGALAVEARGGHAPCSRQG